MSERTIAEITTEAEGLVIAIDGVKYSILQPEDTTLHESFKLGKIITRIIELNPVMQTDDPPEAAVAEFDAAFVSMMDFILKDVPSPVRAKLKQRQRMQIMNAYMGAQRKAAPFPLAGSETAEAGEASSRGSSDSMEATGGPGMTAP